MLKSSILLVFYWHYFIQSVYHFSERFASGCILFYAALSFLFSCPLRHINLSFLFRIFVDIIPIKSILFIFLWTRSAGTLDFTGFIKFSPIISPSGEFIGAKQGLGYLIIYGSQVFKLDWVIMSIVILCIVAMGLYSLINLLEKVYSKRI